MTERPILFSTPMVRAILDGRKTQTRRVLSNRWTIDGWPSRAMWPFLDWDSAEARKTSTLMDAVVGPEKAPPDPHLRVQHVDRDTWHRVRPPVYADDTLWVREAWQSDVRNAMLRPKDIPRSEPIFYAAGASIQATEFSTCAVGWRPSIHMPRWASRINLLVTDVRVQRLQDITETDAIAEGAAKIRDHCYAIKDFDYDLAGLCHSSPVTPFMKLWDHINGAGAWDANPWVYALTFEQKS